MKDVKNDKQRLLRCFLISFPEQFLLFFCQLSQIGLFLVAQSLKAGGIACIEATA
jgi:hypothetical protein